MSEPVAGAEPAEEQVQEEVEAKPVQEEMEAKPAPEEVEVKQETSTATEEEEVQQANDDSSATAMEVDSSHKESNLESAADDEDKPFRRNGASRKRFKWLIDQGYSRNAAAQISKTPFKPKDMREKYIAETGFFKEKINELSEEGWESLDDATKRRVKWLIKNGYTEKDALRLASEPSLKPVVSKRNLPTNNGGPLAKRASEATELLVMAVVAADYPKTLMSKAQTDEFKSAILKEVVAQKDSELKPHFKKSVHVNGYLRIQCSDQETRRWLQRTVAKLAVPEGMAIKVVAERTLLKDVYTGHFPDSRNDTNATILEFIESQNDGISTSEWTILTRREIRDTQTVELMFNVDQASTESILSIGYELNYKFNTVKLRKKSPPGNPTDKGPNPNQRRSFNQPSGSFVPILDSNFPPNRGGNNFNPFSGRGRGKPFRGGGGFNNRGMSNGNRPFDMVDTLYDQLRLISGGGGGGSNPNQWGGNTGYNPNRAPRNYNGQGNRNFFTRSGFY